MFEIFALAIYSVQWLGVVLGVGAEVLLLLAHLMALHDKRHTWLDSIPAVRTAQFIALMLIVGSGVAAVLYQLLVGQPDLLFAAVFGFKWLLIIALCVAYMLERHVVRGRAVLEGFTGATWLALFMVHSVAPIAPWLVLILFYTAWTVVFGVVWGAFVLFMKYTGNSTAEPSAKKVLGSPRPAEKPQARPDHFLQKAPPPPAPKPILAATPAPRPVVAAAPPLPPTPKPVMSAPPPPPPPKPAIVVAAKPPNLPAIEPLELMAPHVASGPARPAPYMPDYNSLPGLSVMPQRPEDLHLQNRGPVVQPA